MDSLRATRPPAHLLLPESRNTLRDVTLAASRFHFQLLLLVPLSEMARCIGEANTLGASISDGSSAIGMQPCENICERLGGGDFEGFVREVADLCKSAREDGWNGLWFVSWVGQNMGGQDACLAAEERISSIAKRCHTTFLCPYPADLPHEFLRDLVGLHSQSLL